MTEASGLACGIFGAPLVEPGYLVLSVRYKYEDMLTPMAGVVLPVPLASVLLDMIDDLETRIRYGAAQPFFCAELGRCQIMYSMETEQYMVGLGLVAGYFSSLDILRNTIQGVLAQIKAENPWNIRAPEWLQRFSEN